MTAKKTLHIYCRANSNATNLMRALRAQELAGMQRANELGYDYKVHVEGEGASKADSTPAVLNQLLEDCKSGKISDVFVTDLDRLTRSAKMLVKLKEKLKSYKVNIHTKYALIGYHFTEEEFLSELEGLISKRKNAIQEYQSTEVNYFLDTL